MLHHVIYISTSLVFFNDTATTEIYTLSLHDALPISLAAGRPARGPEPAASGDGVGERARRLARLRAAVGLGAIVARSEEHTSELQSRRDLVCRLLLEKKKKQKTDNQPQKTKLDKERT